MFPELRNNEASELLPHLQDGKGKAAALAARVPPESYRRRSRAALIVLSPKSPSLEGIVVKGPMLLEGNVILHRHRILYLHIHCVNGAAWNNFNEYSQVSWNYWHSP